MDENNNIEETEIVTPADALKFEAPKPEVERRVSQPKGRTFNPARDKKFEQEARANPFDEMSKEERSATFYRPYTFKLKSPGRRETRDYADAIARLLPVPKGSEPITRETIDKLFRNPKKRK